MSSVLSSEPERPDPRITVQINGQDREIFMSFGLLNELSSLVGGPENVPKISFDPDLSYLALETMLVSRDKRGKAIVPEKFDPPIVPPDLPPEIAEQMIDWAGAHVLDFFVRRFTKNAKLFATRAGPLAEAGSSLTSSVN